MSTHFLTAAPKARNTSDDLKAASSKQPGGKSSNTTTAGAGSRQQGQQLLPGMMHSSTSIAQNVSQPLQLYTAAAMLAPAASAAGS
jgi:hypothetical protein